MAMKEKSLIDVLCLCLVLGITICTRTIQPLVYALVYFSFPKACIVLKQTSTH